MLHTHTHTLTISISHTHKITHALLLYLSLLHTHTHTNTHYHIWPTNFVYKKVFLNFPCDPNGNWLDEHVTERRDFSTWEWEFGIWMLKPLFIGDGKED